MIEKQYNNIQKKWKQLANTGEIYKPLLFWLSQPTKV